MHNVFLHVFPKIIGWTQHLHVVCSITLPQFHLAFNFQFNKNSLTRAQCM